MKKIKSILLLASLTGALTLQAQTNLTAPEQPATSDNPAQAAARAALLQTLNTAPASVSADTNTPAVPAPASPAVAEATTNVAIVTTTTTTATATTEATPQVAPTPAAVPAATAATDMPPATVTATTTTSVVTATTTVMAKPAGIPLIQFSDVPLTTAIENLARQAGINYMLDPKIAYGQPDASGQVKAEPTLSIRWENITAESALLALLDNYGLQMSQDPRTGISRITQKDPTAPPALETRVVQLKFAGVSNMVDSVESVLTDKRSKVIADVRTSQLVVVATESEQQAVDVLVQQLDTATKQVLIETKLVEVSSNPTSTKGIDWTSTLQGQHVAFGNNLPLSPTTGSPYVSNNPTTGQSVITLNYLSQVLAKPGIVANTAGGPNGGFGPMGFLNADGLSAVLSFLNSSSDAQVVSTPRVVTLDNETAMINVSEGYPVFNVAAGTPNTAGGSSVSYTNVGTLLTVTPRISANDTVWLHILPVVSSYAGLASETVGGQTYQAPQFETRSFETRVVVPNAHTLVMGGLVQDSPASTSTKVPLLGDIPGLGYLFRSDSKSDNKDNLLIFITPTIVKDDDFHSTDTQFFSTKPNKRPTIIDPNNLWQGTRPYNWSNPTNTDPAQAIIDEPSVQ